MMLRIASNSMLALFIFLLTGCGGGSSGGDSDDDDSETPTTYQIQLDTGDGGRIEGLAQPCAGTCIERVEAGTALVLKAVAEEGFAFSGWNGDCTGGGDCALTVTADVAVTASFIEDDPGNGNPPTFRYAGIPYPDPMRNTLPVGITPQSPTPNSAPGWEGYDPVRIPKPDRTECTAIYQAGDSLPNSLMLAAGDRICFVDGLAQASRTIAVDATNCSAEAPCWMAGYSGGGIHSRSSPALTVEGKHILFDGLRMDADRSVFDLLGGSSFVTIRNSNITGTGSDGGGAAVDIAGENDNEISHVMIYNNTFDDIGPSDKGASGAEAHQVRPSWYARYIWIVENTFGSSDGDAIQTGNSKTRDTAQGEGVVPEKSPHYIWVAGNRHIGTSENFIDNKNSYHVIISGNTVSVPMRETVILLSNDGEGFWTGHHWAINNRIQGGGGECIGVRGNEDNVYGVFTDYNYVIGNTAYDCNALLSFQSGNSLTTGPETYVLYNTLVSNQAEAPFTTRAPIYKAQNRQESLVEFIGNIIYGNFNPTGGGGTAYITANNYDTTTFTAIDNIYFQTDGMEFPFLARIDAVTLTERGNLNVDPAFENEAEDNYRLRSGSQGINATSQSSAAFSRFLEFYGIDIQKQLALDGVNNIGAAQ